MDAAFRLIFENLTDFTLILGHFTYFLFFLSMLMRNIAWLRALAIVAGLTKIVYRLYFVYDPVTVFWEVILVLLNVGQLLLIWWENRRPKFNEEEQRFISTVAPGLPPAAARALMRRGVWADLPAGAAVTTEGVPTDALTYVSAGALRIERGGRVVARCAAGDFIGEMTYASRRAATATAIAEEPLRTLSFPRQALETVLDAKPVLRYALQASFNRNLIDKLLRSSGGAPEPQAA